MIKYYKKQGFKISVVGFFQVTFYENSRSLVQKWKIVKLNDDHDGVNENGKKAEARNSDDQVLQETGFQNFSCWLFPGDFLRKF